MLRGLVVLLLLANALFLAWSQGWLAPLLAPPRAAERETERLAAQVNPGAVTVLPEKAASAAVSAARAAALACMEAGPLPDDQLAGAVAALAPAGLPDGSWKAEPAASAPGRGLATHWLRVPRADTVTQERLASLPAASFGGLGFRRCGAALPAAAASAAAASSAPPAPASRR